jgi:WD40 repeat protein
MVSALRWVGGKLYSGGSDFKVIIWDTSSMTNVKSFDIDPALIKPISIDVYGAQVVLGCRNGSIILINLEDGSRNQLMKSHSEGELWGLSVIETNGVMTSGDDNKMIFVNYSVMDKTRMFMFGDLIVTNEARNSNVKGRKL